MRPEQFSPDMLELLVLLARRSVRLLVVGGTAVVYHGRVRLTGDIDLFYQGTEDNCDRLYDALMEFWGGAVPAVGSAGDLLESDSVFQFGVPPNRIDLMSRIEGVSFADAWAGRITEHVAAPQGTVEVHLIGLEELIRNKKALARPKDLDDLAFLSAASERNRRG